METYSTLYRPFIHSFRINHFIIFEFLLQQDVLLTSVDVFIQDLKELQQCKPKDTKQVLLIALFT